MPAARPQRPRPARDLRHLVAHRAGDRRPLSVAAGAGAPARRPRSPDPAVGERRHEPAAEREAARASAAAAPDPPGDPRPAVLPPRALHDDAARARRRARARHPDARGRSAPRPSGDQERMPRALRRRRRRPPPGRRAHLQRARGDRRDRRPARPQAGDPAVGHEAQRGRLGRGQRDRGPPRPPGARRPGRARRHLRAHHRHGPRGAGRRPRALPRLPRRARRDRRGADRGRRGPQPERAAGDQRGRRGRDRLDARPAARRRQRPELPGLPLPGRARLRAADRRAGPEGRTAPGRRGRDRAIGDRLRRRAPRRWRLGCLRHRAQPAQGRHHASVRGAGAADRRDLRHGLGDLRHAGRGRQGLRRHRPRRGAGPAVAGMPRRAVRDRPRGPALRPPARDGRRDAHAELTRRARAGRSDRHRRRALAGAGAVRPGARGALRGGRDRRAGARSRAACAPSCRRRSSPSPLRSGPVSWPARPGAERPSPTRPWPRRPGRCRGRCPRCRGAPTARRPRST